MWSIILDVLEILLRHGNALERRGRSRENFFVALPCGRKEDVTCQAVFSIGAAIFIKFLELENLCICEVVAFFAELLFVLREFLDDLLHGHRRRLIGDMRGRLLPGGIWLRCFGRRAGWSNRARRRWRQRPLPLLRDQRQREGGARNPQNGSESDLLSGLPCHSGNLSTHSLCTPSSHPVSTVLEDSMHGTRVS